MNRAEKYIEEHGIDAWNAVSRKKVNSLENKIIKYGVEVGTRKWKEGNASRICTLEKQILKYGLEEGTRKWEEFQSHHKVKGTLPGYIEKHGLELGTEKYYAKNKKLSIGLATLIASGRGAEEIESIRGKHSKNSAITLENMIRVHGEDTGKVKYDNWVNSSRLRSHRCVEYWIYRGYTPIESKWIISSLQNTSSLDKFIGRYGEAVGLEKYISCNAKKNGSWSISKGRVSKLEKVFFKELSKHTYVDIEHGTTCKITTESRTFFCDYADVGQNKIIEIYGDYWHMNPNSFSINSVNPTTKQLAGEKWESDSVRVKSLIKCGYSVLIIWETEICVDIEAALLKAANFLKKEINEDC